MDLPEVSPFNLIEGRVYKARIRASGDVDFVRFNGNELQEFGWDIPEPKDTFDRFWGPLPEFNLVEE